MPKTLRFYCTTCRYKWASIKDYEKCPKCGSYQLDDSQNINIKKKKEDKDEE